MPEKHIGDVKPCPRGKPESLNGIVEIIFIGILARICAGK